MILLYPPLVKKVMLEVLGMPVYPYWAFRGMDAEAERHMDVLERPNKGKPASPIRFEKQKTF